MLCAGMVVRTLNRLLLSVFLIILVVFNAVYSKETNAKKLNIKKALFEIAAQINPILMWSSERSEFRTTGIYFTSALPHRQRFYRKFVLSNRLLMLRFPHFIGSLDRY